MAGWPNSRPSQVGVLTSMLPRQVNCGAQLCSTSRSIVNENREPNAGTYRPGYTNPADASVLGLADADAPLGNWTVERNAWNNASWFSRQIPNEWMRPSTRTKASSSEHGSLSAIVPGCPSTVIACN